MFSNGGKEVESFIGDFLSNYFCGAENIDRLWGRGEYHKPEGPVLTEVKDILQLTTKMPGLFLGISFFEFQVAYWKGGAEMAFGLFGLGGYPIGHFKYADGVKYTSWCLQWLGFSSFQFEN